MYLQNKGNEKLMKIPGGKKFFMGSRTNLINPSHHKAGMLRLLWFMFGPQQGARFGKKLERKVESNGFRDLHHCFGLNHLRPKVKPFFHLSIGNLWHETDELDGNNFEYRSGNTVGFHRS